MYFSHSLVVWEIILKKAMKMKVKEEMEVVMMIMIDFCM
jgi:hypothetical protein